MQIVPAVLVDARNWEEMKPILLEKVATSPFTGLDIEGEDHTTAHDGIKKYRKAKTAKVFDSRRMNVTGFSLYFNEDEVAYYLNLAHADVENRLPWAEVNEIFKARNPEGHWVCHNASFEMVMMENNLDIDPLTNVICTLQMAVTAYGPDEYPFQAFQHAGLGQIDNLVGPISVAFAGYEPGNRNMTAEQGELFAKVLGKQSNAAHSYNGFVRDISFGYGLKKAVKTWFGVDMKTFEQCLNGKAHMGELTGEEVCDYGADDAYWAVRLFHRLMEYMLETNPTSLKTFFDTENPMVRVYADLWKRGMDVNPEAIAARREEERKENAVVLRKLKKHVRALLPFPEEPHAKLYEKEKWYQKNWKRYRSRLEAWATSADSDDAYVQCRQVAGPVSEAWATDRGESKSTGPNMTHYMMLRTMIYDLMRKKVITYRGKVQSDAEHRGKLLEKLDEEETDCHELILAIGELAGIDQRMKLYLNPYSLLTDPETGKMYPQVSCMLATRRMACANPNGMQLAKQGDSTYVRGFFKANSGKTIEYVMVSVDWSQIELVLIGEFSGDPEFAIAYGQTPYQDLHKIAAAELLSAMYSVQITPDDFTSLNTMADDVEEPFGFPLVDNRGVKLTPKECYKYNRGTSGGKGMNFNYWYSGAMSTVAERRGLSGDEMWAITDRYRQRFSVAEEWRQNVVKFCRLNGYVDMIDGLRRLRFEATPEWAMMMRDRWAMYGNEGAVKFGNEMIRATQTRAGNQAVNAIIQEACAVLAKRSILRAIPAMKFEGIDATFKLPIHDELLWVVRWDHVVPFIHELKRIMTDHHDIISKLTMDATASVGMTFEPWHPTRAPLGQVELDEAPKMECLPESTIGQRLDDHSIKAVVDWLRHQSGRLAA